MGNPTSDTYMEDRIAEQVDRIEALEEWVRDSARHHCEAAAALPDSHGEPHRDLCARARTLLSTEPDPTP